MALHVVVVVGIAVCVVGRVMGNGYLLEPPGRSSMWRSGFQTPPNYNDMSLSCGGSGNQWYQESGKCGICGDPFGQPKPRENEARGKYATGTISRMYQQGDIIKLTVVVTTNQGGYFEFRLCKNDNMSKTISHECLNKHLLFINNASSTRYYLPKHMFGPVKLIASLPSEITCSQCVIQWKWRTDNTYGIDENHRSCVGCGPQEEFFACSDIAISSSETTASMHPTRTTIPQRTYTPSISIDYGVFQTCHAANVPNIAEFYKLNNFCVRQCSSGKCLPACYCPDAVNNNLQFDSRLISGPVRITGYGQFDSCHGVGLWGGGLVGLDNWCIENCHRGNCPHLQCSCVSPTGSVHLSTMPSASTTGQSSSTVTQNTASPTWSVTNRQTESSKHPTLFKLESTKSSYRPTVSSSQQPQTSMFHTSLVRVTGHGVYDNCRGAGLWGSGVIGLDNWCVMNCARGNCPHLQCYCPMGTEKPTHLQNFTPSQPTFSQAIPSTNLQETPSSAPPPTPTRRWEATPTTSKMSPPTTVYMSTASSHIPTQVWSQSAATSTIIWTPSSSATPTPSLSPINHFSGCHGVNTWSGVPQLDLWCRVSCKNNFCPSEMCQCT